MWQIEWIDKKGKRQSQVVDTKEQVEDILDSLENCGVDISTFQVRSI